MTKNQKRMILPIIIVVLVILMLALSIIFLGTDVTFIILFIISGTLLFACLAVLIAYVVAKFIILYVLAGVLTDDELEEVKLYFDYEYYGAISKNTLEKILNYLKNKIRTSKCKFIYKKIFLYFDEIFYRENV